MQRSVKRFLWGSFSVFMLFVVGVALYCYWIYRDLPPITTLAQYQPALITKVYDRKGRLLTELAQERREITPFSEIPDHVIKAFLAAEDDLFYEHFGLDLKGIMRAILKNLFSGDRMQGGSSITQQVAKTFFLTPERKLQRKVKEVFLALKLEKHFSKDDILFMYLNQIYFGRGAYGIGAAARMYFDKEVDQLSIGEAAILAGLPKCPSTCAPHIAPEKARQRQLYVLGQLRDKKWIDEATYQFERNKAIAIHDWDASFWQTPYEADVIRTWLINQLGEEIVMRGGLHVYTTIDIDASRAAQTAIGQGLEELDHRQGYRGVVAQVAQKDWPKRLAEIKSTLKETLDFKRMNGMVHYLGSEDAIAKLQKKVSDVKLIDSSMTFAGLVTGFDEVRDLAWVDFGIEVGALPGFTMRWAREPNVNVPAGYVTVKHPWERLKLGDEILLKTYLPAVDISDEQKLLIDSLIAAQIPIVTLTQVPAAQAAVVSMLPQSGELISIVGGFDYKQSQFNRALDAKRQPGSSFKPIVYAAALDAGLTPASILVDTPVVYEDVEREFRWKPKNYEGKFYGFMTLLDALTHSRNVVTIQLVRKLGIEKILEYAHKLGIESQLPKDLSMALGSGVVAPIEMLRVFATFANLGRRPDASFIREIWDASGKLVYLYQPPVEDEVANAFTPFAKAPTPVATNMPFGIYTHEPLAAPNISEFPQVIDPQTAYQLTYLLRSVVERGTGWRARELGRPAAGKTGTTDDNKDSWFVGYTPQIATAVWVGFDQVQALGEYESGGKTATPIWTQYMQAVHQGLPVQDFPIPDGIEFYKIDAQKGILATPLSEKVLSMPFKKGTEPGAGSENTELDHTQLLNQQDYLHKTTDW